MIARVKRVSNEEKRSLALWAADKAEAVLANFEEHCPGDERPRQAIAAARAWARSEIKMMEARHCAVAAHAAARQATVPAAVAAARAAGHAAATAHAGGHAKAAASYAVKSKASRAKGVIMEAISKKNAEHYIWGKVCDGWHLLKSPGLSVIQERVPPGGAETRHYHERAQQFFFVLSGEAAMELQNEEVVLGPQEGLAVPPGIPHRLLNRGNMDLHFLVVSVPPSHGDRMVV